MSLKNYEAFVKTAELGSLTRAAEALGSTQSRISHILTDMEKEYGFPLMQRSRSGVRLTRAGVLVLKQMQAVLQEDRQLQELIASIRTADSGTVRVGAFTSVAVHWLPGIIRSFEQDHPGVSIRMFNGDYHDMDQWLRNEEIDLGFIRLPAPPDMRTIPLFEDPLVAILPRGHRLAALPRIPMDQLKDEPFISLLQSSAQDIRRVLDSAGIDPPIRFTTKDDYAILAMVEQGLGISIVPQLLLEGSQRELEVRPLEPGASRTIALAVPPCGEFPAALAFQQSVTDWAARHL